MQLHMTVLYWLVYHGSNWIKFIMITDSFPQLILQMDWEDFNWCCKELLCNKYTFNNINQTRLMTCLSFEYAEVSVKRKTEFWLDMTPRVESRVSRLWLFPVRLEVAFSRWEPSACLFPPFLFCHFHLPPYVFIVVFTNKLLTSCFKGQVCFLLLDLDLFCLRKYWIHQSGTWQHGGHVWPSCLAAHILLHKHLFVYLDLFQLRTNSPWVQISVISYYYSSYNKY